MLKAKVFFRITDKNTIDFDNLKAQIIVKLVLKLIDRNCNKVPTLIATIIY